MELTYAQISILTVSWLIYFILHSVMASLTIKAWFFNRWPSLERYYRLSFNAVATVLLIPLLAMMWFWKSHVLWVWQGGWAWLANGLALLAIGGFFWTLRYYDSGEFLGFSQLKKIKHTHPPTDQFVISPLHRVVRHPWYFLALLIIWTRDMDETFFISAVLMTGYFWLGSLLEERKLVTLLGAPYERYQHQVPGLIPLPWKVLGVYEVTQHGSSTEDLGRVGKKLKK